MTVAELIEKLENLPPDTLVVQSIDPEGNAFSKTANEFTSGYFFESSHHYDFVSCDDVENDPQINIKHATRAVVLWPKD